MIKKLAKSIREYKKSSILTALFVSLEVLLDVFIPYITADLIGYVYAKQMDKIIEVGAILVLMAIISFVFGVLSGYFCADASSGFAKNLRKDIYSKIQNFSFYNIDKFSTPSLITRITTDVWFVHNAFQMIIRIAIRSPLMLIFTIIMTFTINAKIGIIFLIASPIVMFGLLLILTFVHPIFKKVIKEYDDLNLNVQENIRGIRVVKSFVREDYETKKFYNTSDLIYKDYSKARRILAFTSPLMQFATYTCLTIICWVGATTIVNTGATELNTGQLTTLFAYTLQILMSLMIFSMVVVNITISRASAQRIVEIFDETPNIKNCDKPIFKVKNNKIVFENVSFSYSNDISKLCLKNVNLTIDSGTTLGIIGGTGSSKTTLVSLIPRLYDATSGNIFIGGKNVKDYDLHSLRDSVSMVLQKNVLFSGTIKENLRWGNENATDAQIKKACELARADEFVEKLEKKYDTYIEEGGANISGGQKQRLCIARALLKKPKILILDDSTSAVDTKNDSLIRKALKTYMPKTTKIIIAQRISSIQDADNIIVLNEGEIIAQGDHKYLLKNCEIYQDLYTQQTSKKGVK